MRTLAALVARGLIRFIRSRAGLGGVRRIFENRPLLPAGLAGALLIGLALAVGVLIWANHARAERAVVLIHVQEDGSDYKGNPDCPGDGQPVDALGQPSTIAAAERAIFDCNNLVGTTHLIRTEGFEPLTMVANANPWGLSGPGVILSGNPAALCGATTEATNRPNWNAANNNQYCLLITSSDPGETIVTFGYVYTPTATPAPTVTPTSTPSPTPTPPLAGFNMASPIVKQWKEAAAVGGIAELSDVAEGHASAADHLALAGLAVAGLSALTAGTWYARRRWPT